MKPNNPYLNYYKDHFQSSFSQKEIERDKRWFHSQWQFINSKITIKSKDKILEVGSGLGGIYKFLEDKKIYCGIELDPQAVDFTNQFFKTDCFINVSFEDFYPQKKYDLIFAIEVIEHFCDPIKNIKKIYSLLEKTGQFVGTSPYPFKKNIFADETHNFVLHPENWKKLFLSAGFKKVDLYPMSFIPFLWRRNKHLNPVLPFYCPLPKTLSTCLIIAGKKQ